jgi:TonB-linked SusC/RagA family outer membrane protein
MQLTAMVLLAACLQVSATSFAQKLTISGKNMSLRKVFNEIRKQTDYNFIYANEDLERASDVTLNMQNTSIKDVLDVCFAHQPLTYKIDGKMIIVKPRGPEIIARPQITLQGTVTDSVSGSPLQGVTIQVKGTTIGTTSGAGGSFSLEVPDDAVLLVSYLGYNRREIPVNGRTTLRITLSPSATGLDQVVVIGYGSQKRSEITGAISTVDGGELSSVTTGGIQEALQGRVAGVNITPTSGQPGGALDMNIRGIATFGNSNPLFVIDGVPVLSEGTSRNFNPLATLSMDNIESVQILKDASAAAIYGARAANGVVIITTNRGKSGQNRVQLNVSRGVANVAKYLPLLNSKQYIDYASEAYENAGKPLPISFQEPLLSDNLKTNTDWQKEGFSPATIQNYFLSVSGGNDNATYALSGEYLDQEGTLPNSGFKRYSVNINSDFRIGKNKKLKIGETVGLSRSIWTGTFNQASYNMRQLLQQSPTVPVYDPDADGGFDGPRLKYSPVGRQNSIGIMTLTNQRMNENRLLGNVYADWEIIPGLSNRFSVGSDISFGRNKNFIPTYVMGDRVNSLAILSEDRDDKNVYYITNTTTYEKVFNEVHKLTALVGFTQQQSWATSTGVTVRNFQSNDLQTVGAGFEHRDINGSETGWALRSQMARVSYSYKSKYNLMGVIRRDGSSRFGANNRFGIFPSISGNWIVSNEPFMSKERSISNLTLRASYGKVGSQDIENFAQYATIQPNINYVLGSGETLTPGATFLGMGNADLKWEVTTQTDIGLDLGLFNQQLTFVLDYYIKNTDGILVQLPIPTTSGFRRDKGPFVNAGSVQNKGFEFTATYQSNPSRDFSYVLSANIATNKNRVTSLNAGQPIIAQLASGKQSAYTITQEGGEIGDFYGYVMEGIFKDQADVDKHAEQPGSAPGDVKFKDINGDHKIDAEDQTVIGSPFPDFSYGFNANLRYKNFDFVLFLTGKQGQQLYNLVWSDLNEGEGDNNATTDQLRRWTPDHTNTDVPRAVTGNPGQNTRSSSRFIENASYMRIQNAQLGYSLGSHLLDQLKISKLRVYLSVSNLLTVTNYRGYNPEIGKLTEGARSSLTRGIDFAMYPIPRTIEGGIQVDF